MENLKYKVIKSDEQYFSYCKKHHELTFMKEEEKNSDIEDEIDLLTVLIEKWDDENSTLDKDFDPIQLLQAFMEDHKINATAMAGILDISKGYMSDILHYKKGLSKDIIRILAARFSVRQEVFNRPYRLNPPVKTKAKKATKKKPTK